MEKAGVRKDLLCFRPGGVVLALLLATLSTLAGAQAFPSKPIRWIVAFPPGGAVDIVARMTGPRLAASLGQQVIVDNGPAPASSGPTSRPRRCRIATRGSSARSAISPTRCSTEAAV